LRLIMFVSCKLCILRMNYVDIYCDMYASISLDFPSQLVRTVN
jgi:hypothetical protein